MAFDLIHSRAADVVAILLENTAVRRSRAAFVASLKDEMGLSFKEIAKQLNISRGRAAQLYSLNKFFHRSANSPFANLSTRARNFLENIACSLKLPDDWEQRPEHVIAVAIRLTEMTRTEAFKYRHLGKSTFKEIEDFLKDRGAGFQPEFGDPVL